jgi:hypothetical protein
MTNYTYIQKDAAGVYVGLGDLLDSESNYVGETFDDYKDGAWVLLSDEQLAFREENPKASVEEVLGMQIIPVIRTIEDAKKEKLIALGLFDTSEAVNSFSLYGMPFWITADERAKFSTSIACAELMGEEVIEIPLAGQFFTLPILQAKMLLASIQRYADRAAIVTARHKAAIEALESVEEVDAYNFIAGYPERVTLEIPTP